jgi:hypothetical protein
MRLVGVLLTVAALLAQGNGDSGTDLFYGTDGQKVTISGSRTSNSPDDTSPVGAGDPHTPAISRPCDPDAVRIMGCGIDAVKVTTDEGRPITITDVAQFAPDPVRTIAEPEDVGIADLPTNIVTSASAQTRTGELFGKPVTVRFTPVGVDFDYGDGAKSTSTNGGLTWAALDQAPFTPTSTSHTYRDRGTYDARASVRYSAEVDIGGGWFSVAGELTVNGTTQQIRIFEARTALVARTCAEQPRAPGC